MNMQVRQATTEDAQTIIDFMNRAGGETDNFTFGRDEFPFQDPASEANALARQSELDGFTLMAWSERSRKKGGPELMGVLSVDVIDRPRLCHRATFCLAVLQQFWGEGVGTRLMQEGIARIKKNPAIEVLYCEVRDDNERALRLYEAFGLERTGVSRGLLKAHGKLHDGIMMSRLFHRAEVQEGQPLFYLDDIINAIDSTDDYISWCANLDTGMVEMLVDGTFDEWDNESDELLDPESAEGRWEYLPDRHEIDDWGTMRDFAHLQDDACCQRLLDNLHRRGAYRKFKDECARRGLLDAYLRFKDARHRQLAIDWLEAHECAWTEGRHPIL